jgi:F-type H+-transporting ATPase subunit b
MEQLGIDTSLLLAQIVNFSIIMFVLTKLLYKPILGMLEKRRKEIEAGLSLTEKMRLEEEKMKEKKDKMTEGARKDARRLLEEAKKEAQEQEKRIVSEAHVQAAAIIEKGKAEVERQQEQMRKDLEKEAVDLAVAMARQLTKSILSARDQHKLISKQLKEIESVRS